MDAVVCQFVRLTIVGTDVATHSDINRRSSYASRCHGRRLRDFNKETTYLFTCGVV